MTDEIPLEQRRMKWISMNTIRICFFVLRYIEEYIKRHSMEEFWQHKDSFIGLIHSVCEHYFNCIPEERSQTGRDYEFERDSPEFMLALYGENEIKGCIPVHIVTEDDLNETTLLNWPEKMNQSCSMYGEISNDSISD